MTPRSVRRIGFHVSNAGQLNGSAAPLARIPGPRDFRASGNEGS
jgi:hypothetical protein